MIIEIIDYDANSIGKYTENEFITIPNVNDEIIIKDNHYIVRSRTHESINKSKDFNITIFELILYVEKKVRGTK